MATIHLTQSQSMPQKHNSEVINHNKLEKKYFWIGPKIQVILTWIQNIWATKSWKSFLKRLIYSMCHDLWRKKEWQCPRELVPVEKTCVVSPEGWSDKSLCFWLWCHWSFSGWSGRGVHCSGHWESSLRSGSRQVLAGLWDTLLWQTEHRDALWEDSLHETSHTVNLQC